MAIALVRRSAAPLALCAALSFPAVAQEWTRFRGPNGSGISHARTIPTEWTSADHNWKVPLPGVGHSSPVLWGNRIFLTASDEPNARLFILAIDSRDGRELWRREFTLVPYRRHQFNVFASSTPTVDAHRVYVSLTDAGRSALVAFDHDGAVLWRRDLGPFRSQHGSGVSPILHDGLVILPNEQDAASSLLALDASTGATRWETPRQTTVAAYSTPCLFEPVNGPPALIFNSQSHGISAVSPVTGEVLWQYSEAFTQRSVSSPVIAGNLLIGSCGSGAGGNYLVAVEPGDPTRNRPPRLAYTIRRSAPYVPTSVAMQDRLFLWSDGGIVSCLDAPSGTLLWQERVGGNYFSSPVWIDGRLFGVSTTGDVVVLAATDQFELLARNPLGETTHSTPAVANGRMFLRTSRHLHSVGGQPRTNPRNQRTAPHKITP
jgi:outer membrane protein assembly factor BamB